MGRIIKTMPEVTDSKYFAEVFYTGRVQGVGFRYATLQVAKEFEVTGEVKNLPDGRVQLCAEGERREVEHFRQELEERMKPFIREIEAHDGTRKPQYKTFTITR